MKLELEAGGRVRQIELEPNERPGGYRFTLDGEPLQVEAQLLREGVLSLIVDGRAYRAVLTEGPEETAVQVGGACFGYRVDDPRSLKGRRGQGSGADGPKAIKASMPGRVVRVMAEPGQAVEAGEGVVVIEAMKMQNEMKSPKAGRVAEVKVKTGATVAAGDVLAVID
jgi:biotin carboxyl carrier protein